MDALDLKVINKLMDEGRTTWAELGACLGLSAPAAADRVRRLEEKGVIRGYTALVSPRAVGCRVTAFITIALDHPRQRPHFLQRVEELTWVQECHHIAGEGDYLLKVRCPDLADLEWMVSENLKGLPGVVKTQTTVVLSTAKETPVLPLPAEASAAETLSTPAGCPE